MPRVRNWDMDEEDDAEIRLRQDVQRIIRLWSPMGPAGVVHHLEENGLLYTAQRFNLVPICSKEELAAWRADLVAQRDEFNAKLQEGGQP